MNIKEARLYIKHFRENVLRGCDKIMTSHNRIVRLDDLTDEDALWAADQLYFSYEARHYEGVTLH